MRVDIIQFNYGNQINLTDADAQFILVLTDDKSV